MPNFRQLLSDKLRESFAIAGVDIPADIKIEAANASDPLNTIAEKSGKDEFALASALNGVGK